MAWWKRAFGEGVYPMGALSRAWSDRTRDQIAFVVKALKLKRGGSILDVPCGTGRHAVSLAERGFSVTGVDLSPNYLREAREISAKKKLAVRFVRGDMRRLPFREQFDAAINLFTSFGYFARESEDVQTLRSVHKALKPGGLFFIDTMNAHWLYRCVPFSPQRWTELDDGTLILEDWSLPPSRKIVRTHWIFMKGRSRREIVSHIRLYTRSRLSQLFHQTGFKVVRAWGEMDGSPYSELSSRLILLGQKS